jgi:hypothetical protein
VTSSRLPREVHELLERTLRSIEKVETLRHLRQAPSSLSRDELMGALRMDRESVDGVVGELSCAGLVEASGARGAIGLGPAARTPACEDLLRIYEDDRLAVVSALSALSVARIRDMAARTFSETLVSKKKLDKDSQ